MSNSLTEEECQGIAQEMMDRMRKPNQDMQDLLDFQNSPDVVSEEETEEDRYDKAMKGV